MMYTPIPAEWQRLKALYEYRILDTMPEERYDALTALAAKICNAPVSHLSFVDTNRQWFKSCHGLAVNETTGLTPLSTQALRVPQKVLVVDNLSASYPDLLHPFVLHGKELLFYAGVPVMSTDGYVVGILSIMNFSHNVLTGEQLQLLHSLAAQVTDQLELGKATRILAQKQSELKMALSDLENIAYIASHDLKTPINNVISLAHLIKDQYSGEIGESGIEYVNFINEASYYLSDLVTGIHGYSKAAKLVIDNFETVSTTELLQDVVTTLKVPDNSTLHYEIATEELTISRTTLKQVLLHLLNNAIQYNDKEQGAITISISEDNSQYLFAVRDCGEGIAQNEYEQIFELFKRMKEREKSSNNMGMGLAIVKRLVERMQGTISVTSEQGIGTTFSFSIPKQTLS